MTLKRQYQAFQAAVARGTLKARGWSYRAAAPVLGVTYQHLCYVLNGHRASRRVMASIHSIPRRETRKAS